MRAGGFRDLLNEINREESGRADNAGRAGSGTMAQVPAGSGGLVQMHKRVYRKIHHHLTSERGRLYLKAAGLYAIITLVMFWYVAINPLSVVPNGQSDAYQSMWNLWWDQFSVLSLHASPYSSGIIFFPIGASLVTQDLSPLAGILSAPVQWISLSLAYNLIFLFGFILSGLFSFMLILHLTGNKYGSFIGGLIFAFSPMHIAQSMGHLNWASIEFVPLFILMLLLVIKEKKWRYVVGAGIAFVFITFFGDPLQAIITIAFVIILSALYLLTKRRRELLNMKVFIRLSAVVLVAFAAGAVFFVPILAGMLQPGTLSSANQLSNTPHFMLWSDNLASYFLPSYYNGLFNGISSSYYNAIYGLTYKGIRYVPDVTEKVSYIGYSVLALVLLALYFDYKRNRLGSTWPWLAVLLFFGWLSLGPYIQIMGSVTGIPGVYSLYQHLPIFNLVREPGRFDMIVTLCLGILAAIGFQRLTEGMAGKKARMYGIAFIMLILIEYNAFPLTSAFAKSLTASSAIPAAYSQIGSIKGNFSVLTLPALPDQNSTAPELYPAMAMYYQTAMNGKPIIGGYTSRFNQSQYESVAGIPLASAAAYLESGQGLVYPSPIIGNSTNETLLWLAQYNTAFIPVIRGAYNSSEQNELYDYLYSVFGAPVYQDNTTFIFSTQAALAAHAGRSLTAYTAGTWVPGYSFCGQSCNATLGSIWFGSNVRGAVLFAPNATTVTMNMIAVSYLNGTPLYLYLDNQPIKEINLTYVPSDYSVSFNVTAGFSRVLFAAQNITGVPNPYLTYGIKNITFGVKS